MRETLAAQLPQPSISQRAVPTARLFMYLERRRQLFPVVLRAARWKSAAARPPATGLVDRVILALVAHPARSAIRSFTERRPSAHLSVQYCCYRRWPGFRQSSYVADCSRAIRNPETKDERYAVEMIRVSCVSAEVLLRMTSDVIKVSLQPRGRFLFEVLSRSPDVTCRLRHSVFDCETLSHETIDIDY